MSKYLEKEFNNIRIIPMQPYEETIEQLQEEYFENRLPNDDIFYNCYGTGIDIDDDLILFQYNNHIIASAIGYKCNKTKGEQAKIFPYHILLEDNSIKTFKPISQDELNKYFVRNLTNAKHFIKKDEVKDIGDFINRLEIPREMK